MLSTMVERAWVILGVLCVGCASASTATTSDAASDAARDTPTEVSFDSGVVDDRTRCKRFDDTTGFCSTAKPEVWECPRGYRAGEDCTRIPGLTLPAGYEGGAFCCPITPSTSS
jgi:hypothetical protein